MRPDRKPYAVVAAILAATWGGLEVRAAVLPGDRADAEARLERERAFVALEACFIGGALEPGETLDARVSAISRAQRFEPANGNGGDQGAGAWPKRCAPWARSLAEAGGKGPDADSYLRTTANGFATALDSGRPPGQVELVPLELLASGFRDADRSSVPASVPRAPRPLRPLLGPYAGQWPNGPIWSTGELRDDELRLSVSGLGLVCRVRTDRAEARCLAIPDGARRGEHAAKVLSTPPGGPLLAGFADTGGSTIVDLDAGSVLFAGDGYLTAAARTSGGALLAVAAEDDRLFVFTQPAVGSGSPAPATREAFEGTGTFVAGELLVTRHRDDSTEVRAVGADGVLGEPERIAQGAGWERDEVRACHAGADLFITASRRTGDTRSTQVLVRRADRWAHHEVALGYVSLACGRDRAFLLSAKPDDQLERHTCTFEGCSSARFAPPSFSWEGDVVDPSDGAGGRRVMASCGDRVMMAGVTEKAVELVVAAPEEAAKAPRRLLFQSPLVHDLELFGSSSGVVAIVNTYNGRTMARIGCDGTVEPVVPSYGAPQQ